MSQIICQDVSLGYEGTTVSKNVNFFVDSGDYLCIVGDNGSGKSTLMKALLHLNSPLSGNILFDEGIQRRDIGYMPQQNEAQKDFPASVREIVISGCLAHKDFRFFASESIRQSAKENMARLGISELANKPYSTLSGGQQQRVLLARALCAAEKILLLDEPVSGLDPTATADLYDTISRLNRGKGITVIMITHDLGAVLKYATRVLHMSDKPTFYTSASEYFKSAHFPKDTEGGNA